MAIVLPGWVKRVVVFDTNAYRRLGHGGDAAAAVLRAEQLVTREKAAGIQALGSTVVFLELLAHLGDPADPSYAVCKAAICAAARHCRMPLDTGGHHIAVRAGTDLQLCIWLWNEWPGALVQNDHFIRDMAHRVSEDPSEEALDQFRADLRKVGKLAAETEDAFARSATVYLMPQVERAARGLGFDGAASDLRDAYLENLDMPRALEATAEAHILVAQDHTSHRDSEDEIKAKARFVAGGFEVGIRLYLQMVKKIIADGWDLTTGKKGRNLLWDMQVAFLVGRGHLIDGRPSVVVTGDRDIVDAAEAASP